jgi:hypothetical protein
MDSGRFDALTKVVGGGANRRRVLRGVLGSALVGGAVAFTGAGHAQAQPGCREECHPCEGNQECCPGLECRVTGPGNTKRCTKPPRFPGDSVCPD